MPPQLFALSLKPLLAHVSSNPNIHGVRFGGIEHKYAAYADDILFYVQKPLITLPNLLSAFEAYGNISNRFILNLKF